MTIVNDFKAAFILCKVAFLLLLIASMFTWISYSTTSWVYNSKPQLNNQYYGLWRKCGNAEIPGECTVIDGWANGKVPNVSRVFSLGIPVLFIGNAISKTIYIALFVKRL